MTMEVEACSSDLGTSGESVKKSKRLARGLRARIVELARAAGSSGLTINDAQRHIRDHKSSSVSARFSELEKRGTLVRVFVGYGRPTKCFPKGRPLYITRYDEETKRNVNVYWVPGFAPAAPESARASSGRSLHHLESETIEKESRGSEGVAV